jgi:hypothetical protein
VFVLIGWLALTLGITVGGNKTPGADSSPTVLVWVVFVVIVLGVWRYGFVPYVEATGTDLVVRNAFTEWRIPWNQIKTIKPGSMGLIIVTNDGWFPKTAWAVQKSRAARWMNQRGRADEVTDALMEHVRSAMS